MRWIPLAAALVMAPLLAGCTRQAPPPTFEPTCPNWFTQPGTFNPTDLFAPNHNTTRIVDIVGKGALTFQGYPLDQVELDFHWSETNGTMVPHRIVVVDGNLTMTLRRDGERIFGLRDGESRPMSQWTFPPGTYSNFTVHVQLSPMDRPVDPGEFEVVWDFQRNLDGNPDTPSEAGLNYVARYLYRTCEADGSSTKA